MRQYETFELTLHGEAPAGSQAAIDLEAVFTLSLIHISEPTRH